MSTRAERVAEAQRLRAEGLLLREIAERMGAKLGTVHTWITDPDLSRMRARKDRYRGVCDTCGSPTHGSAGPGRAPTRCLDCLRWTREAILEAVTEWADEHGGIPPRAVDAGSGCLPAPRTVVREFGSWNGALLAGGYALRMDRFPETWEAILAAVRAGEPTADIALRYGVSPTAIHSRFRHRGMFVSDERRRGAA